MSTLTIMALVITAILLEAGIVCVSLYLGFMAAVLRFRDVIKDKVDKGEIQIGPALK